MSLASPLILCSCWCTLIQSQYNNLLSLFLSLLRLFNCPLPKDRSFLLGSHCSCRVRVIHPCYKSCRIKGPKHIRQEEAAGRYALCPARVSAKVACAVCGVFLVASFFLTSVVGGFDGAPRYWMRANRLNAPPPYVFMEAAHDNGSLQGRRERA